MRVAIVGSGISGVTLALRLHQLGVDTTLLSDRTAAEQRAGRVENLVARFPATRDRERQLGVAHWDDVAECASQGIDVDVVGTPLGFFGRFERPAQGIDFRVYVARLVEDYVARGGRLVVGPLPATPADLVARVADHDVIVVAGGRSSSLAAALFAVRRDRSPYTRPQRRLLAGLYQGVAATEPPTVCFNVVPGVGEIFQQPFLTDRGMAAAMLVEAVPGGPLEPITRFDVVADPRGFAQALLNVLDVFAPKLAARVDAAHFRLLGPRDVLQGAITPTVRAGWTTLPDGRLALAIGDAWIVNDPITGQGANVGSYCAWRTAHALHAADRVDAAFACELEDELWAYAGPVTEWTNAWLQPPPEHILEVLTAATAHEPVADAFARGFADPVRFAADLATPEAAAAFTRLNLELASVK
jgi:2-polyprenyl-6-methoxyphenol hydroxylase-like FAD-dependent oxidoreductase